MQTPYRGIRVANADEWGLTDNQVDAATLGKIIEIQNLAEADRKHIMTTVDALLRDAKVRNAHK